MKLQRVLAATDLSATADEALRQAHERAGGADAALLVCHVVPDLGPVSPLFPVWSVAEDMRLPQLREHLAEKVAARVCEVTGRPRETFEVCIEEGAPYAGIIRRARAWGADLVVVGSHGAAGPPHVHLGRVAHRVLRHVHCPVLIARPRRQSGQIVVGTDFSDPALPAVAAAVEEARRTGAHLTIVHSVDVQPACLYYSSIGMAEPGMAELAVPPERSAELEASLERNLAEALRRFGAEGAVRVCWGPPAACLVEIAEELRADLVVVGTAGRTGLSHLLLGSVAEAVAVNARCPVLVVRLSPRPA